MFKILKTKRNCPQISSAPHRIQFVDIKVNATSPRKLAYSKNTSIVNSPTCKFSNGKLSQFLKKQVSPRTIFYSTQKCLKKRLSANNKYGSTLQLSSRQTKSVDRYKEYKKQKINIPPKSKNPYLKITPKSSRAQSIQHKDLSQYCSITILFNERQLNVCFKVKRIEGLINFLKQFLKQHQYHASKQQQIVSFQTTDYNLQLDYYLTLQQQDGSFLNGQKISLRPYYKVSQQTIHLNSFDIVQSIGSGGFSIVYLCRFKQNGKFYAMKVIEKSFIVKNQKKKIVMNERNIMISLKNQPFIAKIHFSFQSKSHLIFVMDYYEGGELFNLVKLFRKMPEDIARFYIAEVLLGLKQIHKRNTVYRDLKPQNIMLGLSGHAYIADFGLAKPLSSSKDQRAYSFCGSPEYMPPEMILKDGHALPVDYYCVGALLYELVTGLPPFYDTDAQKIYKATLDKSLCFPDHCELSEELSDLLDGLLCKDQLYRLGSNGGIAQILNHKWFDSCRQEIDGKKTFEPPVNFRNIQQLRFNIDEMQNQNQTHMKQILKHQNTEKNFKYLKVMNGFYHDPRILQQNQKQSRATRRQYKVKAKKASIRKGQSPSLAPTQCTRRGSINRSITNSVDITQQIFFPQKKNKKCQVSSQIKTLEKRLFKNLNNLF